ncbi:hypothetical protein GOC87_32710 [Sinorhizobium meliloti]|uniref:hypothetical protein n=1 Tax=Rhizobium meliloti TaxID=382 RepID=UPI000B4A5501|nr:hypothetical protein [Sinorhizobium meliloti]ASP96728.1 hypothetical protein CDO24_04325 [Sinorhizobium meliloti]MDW9708240.1 hypothetical protein [Sinorhizobium meliloti]MDW9935360.1 hypothetical protein [Sinorhizobium meliloti]MDX0104358.1 hypothetical protein [Sinorhizobium meliloti]MDX0123019.1 hypothetical protein [Sinorhizobium meliloti]
MEDQQKRKRRINWLWVAFGLTLVYVVVLGGVLLPATQQCDGAAVPLWQKYLACRPANELGDFLSGAFAPVAFLWLVAAVLIQAQELQAQRAELELTRQELADSREVMKEQAEQARNQAIQAQRQADFIGEQTENLKRQAEDYYREKQDRIFDEAISAIHANVLSSLAGKRYTIPTPEGNALLGFSDYRMLETEKAFYSLKTALKSIDQTLDRANKGVSVSTTEIEDIAENLAPLLSMGANVSASYQIKFASLGIRESHEYAVSIVNKCRKAKESI